MTVLAHTVSSGHEKTAQTQSLNGFTPFFMFDIAAHQVRCPAVNLGGYQLIHSASLSDVATMRTGVPGFTCS